MKADELESKTATLRRVLLACYAVRGGMRDEPNRIASALEGYRLSSVAISAIYTDLEP